MKRLGATGEQRVVNQQRRRVNRCAKSSSEGADKTMDAGPFSRSADLTDRELFLKLRPLFSFVG
jgi:hypothetical protein